jgi:hypothetical protein
MLIRSEPAVLGNHIISIILNPFAEYPGTYCSPNGCSQLSVENISHGNLIKAIVLTIGSSGFGLTEPNSPRFDSSEQIVYRILICDFRKVAFCENASWTREIMHDSKTNSLNFQLFVISYLMLRVEGNAIPNQLHALLIPSLTDWVRANEISRGDGSINLKSQMVAD